MLKTLRVTSLVTLVLAAVGVITIVALGLKGDPQIKDFLAKPGIVDELRSKSGQEDAQENKSSPLVALARAVALRFDPPPPPKPKVEDKPPAETARVKPALPAIPQPKVQTSAKFDLLATVVYKTAPERSLALLKTAANKQEWFRQGEKAGYLEVQEIHDGSVIFTQGGVNPQEIFVPAKPQTQLLLKGDQPVSMTGSGSITAQLATFGQGQTPEADAASAPKAAAAKTMDSGKVRMVRPRSDVSARIQRVRSTPPPSSPKEQKKSLNKTMSGIEAIMKRQDESISGGDRKKENEMWMRLLRELNTEKERMGTATEAKEPSEKDVEKNKIEQPKGSIEKKPKDADKPAPAEPNKS